MSALASYCRPKVSATKTLVLLILIQASILCPFRFTVGFPDRDSYRMMLGILDCVARGTYFNSPLLYNRQVSFGYYGLIYFLSLPLGRAPTTVIEIMNAVSLLAAIFFVIPFYLVLERLFGSGVAVAASIVLPLTPVWWNNGLYGHPTVPGMFLFFSALAFLVVPAVSTRPIAVRLIALGLIALSLTFRLDLVLLFPALVAVILYRERRWERSLKESVFYVVGSLGLFKLGQLALPAVQGTAPVSVSTLLYRFQDPRRVSGLALQAVVRAIASLGEAFTPFLLVLALLAFWILIRRRNLPQILFAAGVIIISALFWFPNPNPIRHYVPMAPATSTAASVAGIWLASKISFQPWREKFDWACGAIIGSFCLAVSLGLPHTPGLLNRLYSPFLGRFAEDQYRIRASQIASDLVSVHASKQKIVVLCDAVFVAARMEMLASGVTVRLHYYPVKNFRVPMVFYEAIFRGTSFMMFESSFVPNLVDAALDRFNLEPCCPVLVDPYNPAIIYRGRRLRAHLERTATGTQIQVDGAGFR